MLGPLLADARIAIRTLARDRGFTAASVLTLGLGMSLASAALVVVNAYLLHSLPYPAATRLYSVRYAQTGQQTPSNLEQLDWAAIGDVIEHPIAWDLDMFYLIGGDQTEAAPGAWVTPGFAEGLGIRAVRGRGFEAGDFLPGAPQVALISHRLWQSRFGADTNVAGRRFDAYVSDRPDDPEVFTIVGVLPPDFWHVNPYTQVLTPLRAPSYPYMVRLREGVPADVAAARISDLVRAGSSRLPAEWKVELVSTHGQYVAAMRPILRTVAWAAGLVLLIAWANVGGLVLVRTTRRRRELAVRLALGAGRAQVARLLAVDAVLITAGAVVVGLAAAGVSMPALAPILERELGRRAPGGALAFGLDWTVTLAMAGIGLLVAIGCALAPLAACWKLRLLEALHATTRTATEGPGSQRTRTALIALEVAASLALLAGSMLMVQSVVRLLRVDFGIRADGVVCASLTLRQRTYPDAASQAAFYDRLLARASTLTGVESAALATGWTFQPASRQTVQFDRGGRTAAQISVQGVAGDYFAVLGVPLVAGRTFTTLDRAGSEAVAIVSDSLARRLWPDGPAIGQRVHFPAGPRIVVGIAGDVRQTPADDDLADLYVPLQQTAGRFAWLYLRASGPQAPLLAGLRSAASEIDPELSLTNPRPLQTAFAEQQARPKFLAWLLGGFSAIAALLSLVGVYGVIAYAVRQREREIALRVAIGADPRRITAMFLRQGGAVVAAGLVAGLLGAVAVGRAIESHLFGVRPGDPLTIALAFFGFGAAGLLAVWWPARRAAATDPAIALREE
jgi:predicted permease